jgi:hypothetical protein
MFGDMIWIGLGNSIFAIGYGVAWNGYLWVAVGTGTHSIAYSSDGTSWTGVTGVSATIFTTCNGVAWNGSLWVAVGSSLTNKFAYSYDGINWTGLGGNSVFSSSGNSIAWNGTMWVATGSGTNSTAYSYNGFRWTGVSSFSDNGQGVAFNSKRPYTLTFPTNATTATPGTVSAAFPAFIPATSRLDVVSDTYYNQGYTNFSITVNTHAS